VTKGRFAGLGATAFGLLGFLATVVQDPPGGTYHASNVARFVDSGHRPAVFAGTYLAWIAIVGLLLLLAKLRTAISDGGRASVFWGLSVAGAAAWVAGWSLSSIAPIAMGFGGKAVVIPAGVVYALVAGGWVVIAGGAALIGCALLALTVAPSTLPAWVRWSTLAAAVAALAALAYLPFFLVYLWAVVMGVWLLAGERGTAPETAATASAA
jgi:hypothetical protein